LPPEATLVYNLKCSDYVSILCGSLDQLHEAFSKLNMDKVSKNRDVKSRTDYYSDLKVPGNGNDLLGDPDKGGSQKAEKTTAILKKCFEIIKIFFFSLVE